MKTTSFFVCGAAGGLLFSVCPPAGAAEPVEFQPQFKPGNRYLLVSEIESSSQMAMGQETVTQESAMEFSVAIAVEDGGEGKPDIARVTFPKTSAKISTLGQTMTFDSENPDASNPLVAQMFKGFDTLSYVVELGEKGKVLDVRAEGDAGEAPEGGFGMMASMGFGPDQIRLLIEGYGGKSFPEAAVEPGAEWDYEETMKMAPLGEISVKLDYTYEGLGVVPGSETELPKVTATGGLADKPEDPDAEEGADSGPQIMEITKMDIKAESYYDPEKQFFVYEVAESDTAMTMNNGEATIEVPVRQKTITTLKEITKLGESEEN